MKEGSVWDFRTGEFLELFVLFYDIKTWESFLFLLKIFLNMPSLPFHAFRMSSYWRIINPAHMEK